MATNAPTTSRAATSTVPVGQAPAADDEAAGGECALERATWRLSRRRFLGSEAACEECDALALVEAWRKTP